LLGLSLEFRLSSVSEVSNKLLSLKIPDLDSTVSSSTEPVSGWAENEGVDGVVGIEGVEVLSFIEVPKSGSSVSASRSAEGSVRRNSDGVDVSSVTSQVGSQLAVGQVPDLNSLVPSTRNNDWVLGVWRESNTADPVRVSVLFNGVLALSQSVPQLDGLVSGSRDDLSVVSRESNAQDILAVSNKSSGGGSVVEIPQSQGSIPRSRESELAIEGDDEILNKVSMSLQALSWDTIVLFAFSGDVPDQQSLVS